MVLYIRSTLAVFVFYEATIQLFSDAATLELTKDIKEHSISFDVRNQFEEFLKEHGKTYGTGKEKELRLKIFQNNLKAIEELNASDKGTAVYGVTEFADLTTDEFKMKIGAGFKKVTKNQSLESSLETSETVFSRRAHEAKRNLEGDASMNGSKNSTRRGGTCKDWTAPSNPYMTPVRNYGSCKASWAMGPVEALEISYSAKIKKITPLSVQQVIDCSNGNKCSAETAQLWRWEGYFDNPGLVAEADYKWVGKKSDHKCLFTKSMKIAARAALNELRSGADIEAELSKYPVVTAINSAGFQFYKKGVMALDNKQCPESNTDNTVVIVGCGTEKATDGDVEYWVLKNQLGPSWGEKGYLRLKKGTCGTGLYFYYFPYE